jgi:hypothetical protein
MTKKKVLFTGIDPKLIDSSMVTTAGWDASRVQAAAQDANKRLVELGYEVQICLLDLGETAESVLSDTLSREKFDYIMVGAGVRTLPQHTFLFEKIMNTIHQKAHHLQNYVSIPLLLTLLKQYFVGHNQQYMA